MKEINKVGVIGGGSFGKALTHLLSKNVSVLVYSRRKTLVDQINNERLFNDYKINENVSAVHSPEALANQTKLIFPMVDSAGFRTVIKSFANYLKPDHYIIHGTKGFDFKQLDEAYMASEAFYTMSEVIAQETKVKRFGCLAGPNLASEIMKDLPTGGVIASAYDEVINAGNKVLSSDKYFVFGSHNLMGSELAGALKNIIAFGTGVLKGKALGKNMEAMLITKGLHEIIYIGEKLGVNSDAFLGTAGIGDLIATATSHNSRNYKFGRLMGEGKTIEEAKAEMLEVAEGIRTLKFAKAKIDKYEITAPVIEMLYKFAYEAFDIDLGIKILMKLPYMPDVHFK